METDSAESGFLSIFALLTFFIFLITNKYSHKLRNGIILDQDFSKPQSFHKEAVARSGGIACIISLMIFLCIYYLLFLEILYSYIFISLCLFFIGYLDDIKIKINPSVRLLLMSIFLLAFIFILPIKIYNIDLDFLNVWLQNEFFLAFFTLLCFLFIINGANLIDGFNGLLAINLIIINSALLTINMDNNQFEFSFFLIAQIIILLSFLLFNFPKAKIFLGDSGSYLMGSLVALNTIFTNNLNPNISSFFFCILLFYLFFEVFFSFIRKIYQKKSPVQPDSAHLHMLSYKKIHQFFGAEKSNYINSIAINFIFSVLALPSIYFADNSLICRYWFFSLILIYILIYLRLYRLTKN
ncbi:MAG: Fuc2NAc and GlcNAc transferase [Pelagibacterales bacterium]|jgi:UDP-GlcNAc:undecaprenyl-phosphate GlcNAc-1-phosphate transferase|nr:Fuc2NAc and GlcNAc transferase [Pelagibacterales bacterium]